MDAIGVNAPRAVMLSIGELARRDGVSKPAVSRKVKNLAAKHGLFVERDENGRVSAVNAAQYDHLRGRTDDPSKAQVPVVKSPGAEAPNESYDEALRQKTWTEGERIRLKLEEERRQLVRTVELGPAAEKCGDIIVRIIKNLLNEADEHALIAVRDGSRGLMLAYKAVTDRQCNQVAEAMIQLATLAKEKSQGGGDGGTELPMDEASSTS